LIVIPGRLAEANLGSPTTISGFPGLVYAPPGKTTRFCGFNREAENRTGMTAMRLPPGILFRLAPRSRWV
jgi:hypothetical protein